MKLPSLKVRQQRADRVCAILATHNPDARCELLYNSPFQLLVAVVLSAQATDKSVNAAMAPLFAQRFDPETVIAMGEERFRTAIKTIGLANTKARNVVKLATILRDQYGAEVPRERAALESLPGVGRKTANVVLAEIYREPTLAVDTHVFRVTQRLGLQASPTPEKAELELLKVIDKRHLPQAHHLFILHGRYVCKARGPACHQCVIQHECPTFDKLKKIATKSKALVS